MRLTKAMKEQLLNTKGEFNSEYDKHLYLCLMFADLGESMSNRAESIMKAITELRSEYQRVLEEAEEYAKKFEEEYEILNNLKG